MNYQTFQPCSDLESVVKCYWTLEIPPQDDVEKQLVIPDGCIEMIFILGDDVKRFTSDVDFIIQPRDLVLGQITKPFFVQPMGYVNSFAVRFYPHSFSNFITGSIENLSNNETPLAVLFGESAAHTLTGNVVKAKGTPERIQLVETFLLEKLADKVIIESIVTRTVDALLSTRGQSAIGAILGGDLSKRRQLERKFIRQIGMSPKQLGKVIRLQSALELLLSQQSDNLTQVAYEGEYYDQSHFIKDFREFTGTTPRAFIGDKKMKLSSLFYKKT